MIWCFQTSIYQALSLYAKSSYRFQILFYTIHFLILLQWKIDTSFNVLWRNLFDMNCSDKQTKTLAYRHFCNYNLLIYALFKCNSRLSIFNIMMYKDFMGMQGDNHLPLSLQNTSKIKQLIINANYIIFDGILWFIKTSSAILKYVVV